jgi:hypothetical protein
MCRLGTYVLLHTFWYQYTVLRCTRITQRRLRKVHSLGYRPRMAYGSTPRVQVDLTRIVFQFHSSNDGRRGEARLLIQIRRAIHRSTMPLLGDRPRTAIDHSPQMGSSG